MGPSIFNLPVLLALAYLGIGYCAWIMALQILGYADRNLSGASLVAVPLLASSIMTAWDLAMDPDWATLDHAWIWHRGGSYYGVPISNFFGWFGTACVYYFAFALYRRSHVSPNQIPSAVRRLPALLYAVCALGNLLILRLPMAPPVVVDASGRQWQTSSILTACAVVSLSIMAPFAVLAIARAATPKPHSLRSAAQASHS
jgi:putative membrane protein